jgi:hypothetical protein
MDDDDDYDAPPMRSGAPAGGGAFARVGLFGLSQILFWVGIGCLGLALISVVLPWITISMMGVSASASGTGEFTFQALTQLVLSLGALVFALVALFALKNASLFNIAVYVAAGWGVLGFIWRIIDLIVTIPGRGRVATGGGMPGGDQLAKALGDLGPKVSAGFGVYISIIALLGVAGTFGFIAFQKLTAGKARSPRRQVQYAEDEQ